MRFLISGPDNVVAIDNVAASVDCSALSSAIKYVIWTEEGSGFTEPSSGIALRAPFTDPSPYQSFINGWMTAQGAQLTLAQAQTIKIELIGAIYQAKTQAPLSVAVSAGSYSFSTAPQAVAQYSLLGGLAYISALNTVIENLNALNTSTYGWGAVVVYETIQTVVNEINESTPFSYTSIADISMGGPSNPTEASSLSVPSIQIVPATGGSPVTLTPADLQTLILAINTKINTEQAVNVSKQAAVNALTSVSAVIAYDATTGW